MEACIEKILPGNRYGGPTVSWVIMNTVIYYVISAILLFATIWIPSSDTGKTSFVPNLYSGSNAYRLIFYRGDNVYNTTYFPWSNFVYYTLMNMFGHFFVNTSNLNFERKHILYSSHSKYRDFLLVFFFAPIFFIISSIIVLRAPNDLASTKGS